MKLIQGNETQYENSVVEFEGWNIIIYYSIYDDYRNPKCKVV